MSNFSDPSTLATPAGSTVFNPAGGGDGFYMTADTTGLGQTPVRANVFDKPQTRGSLVEPGFGAGRHLLIVAQYKISTGTIDDRDAAFDALEAHLESIVAANGTWTRTHRGVAQVLTVICDVGMTPSGGPQLKQATFGLVAANPDWV